MKHKLIIFVETFWIDFNGAIYSWKSLVVYWAMGNLEWKSYDPVHH